MPLTDLTAGSVGEASSRVAKLDACPNRGPDPEPGVIGPRRGREQLPKTVVDYRTVRGKAEVVSRRSTLSLRHGARSLALLTLCWLSAIAHGVRAAAVTHAGEGRPLEAGEREAEDGERVLVVPMLDPVIAGDADRRVADPDGGPVDRPASPGVSVDGRLDDAAWARAARSAGFRTSPDGGSPRDETEVLVIQDALHLYVGVRLDDGEPERIVATRRPRDEGLGFDDAITVELDTFLDGRNVSSFSLNPLGVQSDDIGGGRSKKIEWKGDWEGAAALTDSGWTAEFAIPFAILNYRGDASDFGVNFKRYQSRTLQYSWWKDVSSAAPVEKFGRLAGLELPSVADSRRDRWTSMAYALVEARTFGNGAGEEGDGRDARLTVGADVRYQPRPDLTAVVALNPDFSQIERAVSTIGFSYSEKALEDLRPFFAEGRDYLDGDDDEELFYSNRIDDFDLGAKVFGRGDVIRFGALATLDAGNRRDLVARASRELDPIHTVTAATVLTDRGELGNAVATLALEGRRVTGPSYSLDWRGSLTEGRTPDAVDERRGTNIDASVAWAAGDWSLTAAGDRHDDDYVAALGLIDDDLPGTRGASLVAEYYRERSDSPWPLVEGYTGLEYRRTDGGLLQGRKGFLGGSVEFRNAIRTSFYAEAGPYRPVSDAPGTFAGTVNDDRYASVSVDVNTRSVRWNAGLQHDRGRLGGGDYAYTALHASWSPVENLRLKLSGERTESFGTTVQVVATGSWRIDDETSVGARYQRSAGDGFELESYRLSYGRAVRRGVDVFAVYDEDGDEGGRVSLKLTYTF